MNEHTDEELNNIITSTILRKILTDYSADGGDQRFGQYFCDNYITLPWPELYYAKYNHALKLIKYWIRNNRTNND